MKSTKYENIEFGKCDRFGKQGNIPTPPLKNYPTAGVLYRPSGRDATCLAEIKCQSKLLLMSIFSLFQPPKKRGKKKRRRRKRKRRKSKKNEVEKEKPPTPIPCPKEEPKELPTCLILKRRKRSVITLVPVSCNICEGIHYR